MEQLQKRPKDLELKVRRVDYEYTPVLEKTAHWDDEDPILTHFLDALQATFPEGERFFIEAARDSAAILRRKGKLPDRLAGDLDLFIRQEGAHGKQHDKWNAALSNTGFPRMEVYNRQIHRLRVTLRRLFSPRWNIACTAGAEHHTANLAHLLFFLKPGYIARAKSPFRELLMYHAVEELEHKSVCYDLFQKLSGNYFRRIAGFAYISLEIAWMVYRRFRYLMMKHDRWDRADRRAALRFFFGKGGFLRSMAPRITVYLKPSFHPWNTDERGKIEREFGEELSKYGIPAYSS
jgi:hypothetical protein